MLTTEQLRTFTAAEDERYTLQVTLQRSRILGAADSLDLYSCHSQPHVLEVMEQCDKLLTAFAPWLKEKVPGVSPAWMRDQLLLAAKLHDVGMCGTDVMRDLLAATDGLYALLCADQMDAAVMHPYLAVLRTRARDAALTTDTWMELVRLAADPVGHARLMLPVLAAYHEEIKSAIRKQHAANSGRYILSHAEEIAAHYGPDIDVATVAALAALHSSSSLDKANIVPDGEHYDLIREHIRNMVQTHLSAAEAARITDHTHFRRIVHLAALLRLCDTRRSGSRLTNMDQARLVCEVREGRPSLYKEKDGLREVIPLRSSFEILASEALTEFGPVTINRTTQGWHIRHEITLHHAEVDDLRAIFASSRLKSYANEINTGALVYRLGYTHEIFLHLEGLPPFAAAQAAKRFRAETDWLRDSPLQIVVL